MCLTPSMPASLPRSSTARSVRTQRLGRNTLSLVDNKDQIVAAIRVLANVGPGLGRPMVDTVVGSSHNNMKELRPGSSGRSEVRILFALDPKRRAIILVAGDKQGRWERWYSANIPVADEKYDEHLDKLRKQDEAAKKTAAKAPSTKGRRKKDGK